MWELVFNATLSQDHHLRWLTDIECLWLGLFIGSAAKRTSVRLCCWSFWFLLMSLSFYLALDDDRTSGFYKYHATTKYKLILFTCIMTSSVASSGWKIDFDFLFSVDRSHRRGVLLFTFNFNSLARVSRCFFASIMCKADERRSFEIASISIHYVEGMKRERSRIYCLFHVRILCLVCEYLSTHFSHSLNIRYIRERFKKKIYLFKWLLLFVFW